jgi:hypothetical protein
MSNRKEACDRTAEKMRSNKKRLSITKRIAVFITTETVQPIGISLALSRLMTGQKKKFPPPK